jgi:hypothetical protein
MKVDLWWVWQNCHNLVSVSSWWASIPSAVIFFESGTVRSRFFKESRLNLLQASAVAAEGASANVKYTDGVMVLL